MLCQKLTLVTPATAGGGAWVGSTAVGADVGAAWVAGGVVAAGVAHDDRTNAAIIIAAITKYSDFFMLLSSWVYMNGIHLLG